MLLPSAVTQVTGWKYGAFYKVPGIFHHHYSVHPKYLHLDALKLCYLCASLSFEGLRIHTASTIRSRYLTGDSNKHDQPPSNSSSQTLNNMWHEKIKSLSEEMLLCCQQMAASARWTYGEHQRTSAFMFDEVNVCVLSAVYSSWSLSYGAPSDTYGVICLNSSGAQEMGGRKMARSVWGVGFGRGRGQMFLHLGNMWTCNLTHCILV